MTNIENDQNIIIEGCYIPADQITDFEPEYLRHITAFYLGFSERYIKSNFISGIVEHRSETEYKDVDDYMNQDNFIQLNLVQKLRCKEKSALYFEINEDYEKDLQAAYDFVDQQVNEKLHQKYNK